MCSFFLYTVCPVLVFYFVDFSVFPSDFFPQTAKHWGSNLGYREWESVTPIPGSCFPLVFLSPSLSGQMPDTVTPAPGSCLRLSPCVSQALRSDARCCDAGSGVVSPACLAVSPSLCGQTPDAVTPAPGSCLPLVLLCLPSLCGQTPDAPGSSPACVSRVLRSDARCCDAGWLRPSLDAGSAGWCLPLVCLCLPVSAVRCEAGSGFVSPACLPAVTPADARCRSACVQRMCLSLGQAQCIPVEHRWVEPEASNVEPSFFLDKQTNRDIRLIALLRILSCF